MLLTTCVAGDERYFEIANLSLNQLDPSKHRIMVWTTHPEKLRLKPGFDVRIFEPCPRIQNLPVRKDYLNWRGFKDMRWATYSYILGARAACDGWVCRFDVDAYFRGDPFSLMEEHLEGDILLVERNHPLMRCEPDGKPGSGCTIWRSGYPFEAQFFELFEEYDQTTVQKMWEKAGSKLLTDPRFHFTFPFQKNKNVRKEDLEEFDPCYFHLRIEHAAENWRKLARWFDPGNSSSGRLVP